MARTALKKHLKLEICAFFVDEFQAAIDAEQLDNIEIVPIQGACDDRRYPAKLATSPLSIETPILNLMGVCSGQANCSKKMHSCFELLLDPEKIESLLSDGVHLLTPAMVRAYPETLQSLNETPEILHAYFAESVRTWMVVDLGVSSLTAAEQAAFIGLVGGTLAFLPTQLHLLRVNLHSALRQFDATLIAGHSTDNVAATDSDAIVLLQRRLADYTMAYDLIGRLIPYQGERGITHAILELFYMLCAPRAVHLLLVHDGPKNDNNRDELVRFFSMPDN